MIRYERRNLWAAPKGRVKSLLAFWDFARFSVHGDTQAVFEYEPPQSVLNAITKANGTAGDIASENTSLKGDNMAKPQLKRANTAKRKDSMAAISGFTEHLSEFFHEHGADNVAGRLEALEASNRRIEAMLRKLSQDMGDDDSEGVDRPHVHQMGSSDALDEEESP